jgi:hypothetical protein
MNKKIHPLLERINQIQQMERGKICQMSGKKHYNHQTWQNGRNVVRYVQSEKVEPLQKAIDGYQLCMELIQQYAEEIIQNTRLNIGLNQLDQSEKRVESNEK